LFSKMRTLSAQIDAYLTDGLWLRLASHANAMIDRLADGLKANGEAEVTNTIGANMLFAQITLDQHKRLQDAGAGYYTMSEFDPDGAGSQRIKIRLVASFRTKDADVDRFLSALAG
ncbi:MAG: low specificity L-threonine aldolase, partial [Pseudomonadota bacterium]